jgi:hypothetical protein
LVRLRIANFYCAENLPASHILVSTKLASISNCVRAHLQRRTDLNGDSIFFAYDTGALESFQFCRAQKINAS